MALHVLAYNLTRVINILGVKPLIAAIQTWGCASCASAPPDRSPRTAHATSIPARNCDNM
jgi:hypothetical protein